MWLFALVLILGVTGLGLFAFRKTTISVKPRTHTISFDQARSFNAYPAQTSATGTLAYSVQKFDVEESQVVSAQGTAHAEHKASGSVSVINEFSAAPVKLIKNTRFATPEGLVFRTPADVVIPGMKGSNPGSVSVTVVADQPGPAYNVAPTAKFSLPGLKGGAMFAKVYARSTVGFTGGFSGDEPAVAADVLRAAQAEMRARIQDKIQNNVKSLSDENIVFSTLAQVSYEDAAPTNEDAGHVRLHEKAHIILPTFPHAAFIKMIATDVSTDENARISLLGGQGYGIKLLSSSSTLGVDPLSFSLTGSAQLVWEVDASALSQALAGKDESAFQTIVNGFSSIQEARARIEPFWQNSFPKDPASIVIVVSEPVHAE